MIHKINLSNIALFDLEGNGFYEKLTKIHCMVVDPNASGNPIRFGPNEIKDGVALLRRFDWVVAHNGINYDIPALVKLGFLDKRIQCFDTLVASRLLFPDRPGGHSLKAWGVRLDILKGDYGESEDESIWDEFTPEMMDYCEQDVTVLRALYFHLLGELKK